LAAAGLATTAGLIIVLYREHGKVRRGDATMFLILLVLYGLQLANSIRLGAAPHNVNGVNDQGLLAIGFFMFGIARAWQLVGAREFNLATAVAAMVIHRPGRAGLHPAEGEQPGRPGPAGPEEP
jgi:hypothetical protein